MINLEQLNEIHPIYAYPKGDTVSFDAIKRELEKIAKKFQVPMAFDYDVINSGNLLSPVIEDCLVLYHPEYKNDYRRVVFRISREGDTAFIGKYYFGEGRAHCENEKNYYKALLAIFEFVKC